MINRAIGLKTEYDTEVQFGIIYKRIINYY